MGKEKITSFHGISWKLTASVGEADLFAVGDVVGRFLGTDTGEDVGEIGFLVGDFVGYLLVQ